MEKEREENGEKEWEEGKMADFCVFNKHSFVQNILHNTFGEVVRVRVSLRFRFRFRTLALEFRT